MCGAVILSFVYPLDMDQSKRISSNSQSKWIYLYKSGLHEQIV